jgi:glycosyltransferase involved in cell wall biosynthesis
MKILNMVYSLGKGGTERAAQNFATAYSYLGNDSRVLFTQLDGPRREELEHKSIPIYDQKNKNDLTKILEWCPEVVHLHSHGLLEEDFKILKDLLPNAKYIETNVFSRPSPWVDELDVSFQLSQWCCWRYTNRSRGKHPAVLIPYPVNTESFRKAELPKALRFREQYGVGLDDIIIGRIGQNFSGKWSKVLLDVYEKLRISDVRLKLLVVNPPESIINRLSKSPYRSDIVVIDAIYGDEELAICYSAIDIFLHIAEQGESFGMVLAESLLCETAVVTLSTPWTDNSQGEVVGNRIGGLVATNKKDVERLVKLLVENQELRKKLGSSGRERILRKYDSHAVAQASLNFLVDDTVDHRSKIDLFPIMQDTEGKIGIFSYLVLKSNRFLGLLRFSTGYSQLYLFPKYIFLSLFAKFKTSMRGRPSD